MLLRRSQYRRADAMGDGNGQASDCAAVVQPIVLAKLLNSRAVLLRAARDSPGDQRSDLLKRAAQGLAGSIRQAEATANVDALRGVEGEAANLYFGVFAHLITRPTCDWPFQGRNRRPPRDPINALLSFLYTLLMHDACSAVEAAGLDAQVGFLHRDRPGRPSLALA